jgi:hypothetical protein
MGDDVHNILDALMLERFRAKWIPVREENASKQELGAGWLLIASVPPAAHFTSPLVGEVGSHRQMRSG